jgi:competence protein ComEA
MRLVAFLLALVLSSTGFVVAIGARTTPGQTPEPSQKSFPDAPGKDTIERLCSTCHSLNYLTNATRTPKEWTDILDLMESLGAPLSEEEWAQIRRYILGKLATVEINKAAAVDLAAVLEIDEKLASAVVAYRMANGDFKTIEDVKKVPDLDAKTVDFRKDRIEF